jgi:hypothetical protein
MTASVRPAHDALQPVRFVLLDTGEQAGAHPLQRAAFDDVGPQLVGANSVELSGRPTHQVTVDDSCGQRVGADRTARVDGRRSDRAGDGDLGARVAR